MTLDEQIVKLIQAKDPANQNLLVALIVAQANYENVLSVIVTLKDNPDAHRISKTPEVSKRLTELLKPSMQTAAWHKDVIDYPYAKLYELALTILEFKTPDNLEMTLRSYHNYLDGLYINAVNTLKNDKGHNKDIEGATL